MVVRAFPDEICIWISEISKGRLLSPLWAGIFKFVEGLSRTKKLRKKNCPFFCLIGWSETSLLISYSWTEVYTIGCSGSQVSGFEVNYATGFPGCPACRQHIMGLLSLWHRMSQFLILISFYVLLVLFPWRILINTPGKRIHMYSIVSILCLWKLTLHFGFRFTCNHLLYGPVVCFISISNFCLLKLSGLWRHTYPCNKCFQSA